MTLKTVIKEMRLEDSLPSEASIYFAQLLGFGGYPNGTLGYRELEIIKTWLTAYLNATEHDKLTFLDWIEANYAVQSSGLN